MRADVPRSRRAVTTDCHKACQILPTFALAQAHGAACRVEPHANFSRRPDRVIQPAAHDGYATTIHQGLFISGRGTSRPLRKMPRCSTACSGVCNEQRPARCALDVIGVDVQVVRRCGAARHDELRHGQLGRRVHVLSLHRDRWDHPAQSCTNEVFVTQ
jgi:hypothetical protein